MKFLCSAIVNLPIDKVVELYINPDNLKHWQDGFISFEHISGDPGAVGSKSKLLYTIGKRQMELIETIRVNDLPEEFSATYAAKSMVNNMTTNFTALSDNKTRYDMHIDYTKFNGILPKLMSILMPGMFKKQSQKWLDQFKVFAESN